MNTREKAAFLRANGWERVRDSMFGGHWYWAWRDPNTADRLSIDEAVKRASRRKAQRDTRRLKAAGWTCEKRDQWIRFADGFDFAGLGKMCTVYTRAEALKQLGIK